MENKVLSQTPAANSEELKKEPQQEEDSLKWAKDYVAQMNDEQRKLLQNFYATAQEKKKIEEEEKAKKEQQQSILDSLIRQVPITVDVRRSSTSPDSQLSSDSCDSMMNCVSEEDVLTVKDVIIGNMKRQHQQIRAGSPYEPSKTIYRPRGSRERVLFDNYMFVFDKLSYDAKKKFYRCERKNTCPARIHTPYDSERVIQRVQTHNHPAPTSNDLLHYEIDYERVRHGHILPLTMTTKNYVAHQPIFPTSMLTPQSDVEEEGEEQKDLSSPMDILNKLIAPPKEEPKELTTVKEEEEPVDRKPAKLSVPPLFYGTEDDEEDRAVDMMLTKYLLKNQEFRKAFSTKKQKLPMFFPGAKKEELVLFVADYNQENAPYQMLKIEKRNEKSIRTAIEKHLGSECNRSLMLNVSAKINVPLQQHMIDQWKTEEFIRLDSSKPNCWKIHNVAKIDE